MRRRDYCRWSFRFGAYESDCGEPHTVRPNAATMKFCCYCGRPLLVQETRQQIGVAPRGAVRHVD